MPFFTPVLFGCYSRTPICLFLIIELTFQMVLSYIRVKIAVCTVYEGQLLYSETRLLPAQGTERQIPARAAILSHASYVNFLFLSL